MYERYFDQYKNICQYWLVYDDLEILLSTDERNKYGIEKKKNNLTLDIKRYSYKNYKTVDK